MTKKTAAKVTVLLGAGASIDAGLPDTNALTFEVYNRLSTSYDKIPATFFGYVVSKLASRAAKAGGSPFGSINIEQAFETISRLINLDADPISEFVYSWDPALDIVRKRFDSETFIRHLSSSFRVDSRRSLSGSPYLQSDSLNLRNAAASIEEAFSSSRIDEQARQRVLGSILGALIDSLSEPPKRTDYIDELCRFIGVHRSSIATLNYDTYLEDRFDILNVNYDYGLEGWNDRKQASWEERFS